MQKLFGKLLVTVAYKLGVPIFVVYYSIWLVVAIVVALSEGVDELFAFLTSGVGIVLAAVPLVLYPIVWHFTTGGRFWKVPTETTLAELFGQSRTAE